MRPGIAQMVSDRVVIFGRDNHENIGETSAVDPVEHNVDDGLVGNGQQGFGLNILTFIERKQAIVSWF